MKKNIFLVLFCFFICDLQGQTNILETKVTIEFSNVKLGDAVIRLNKKLNHVLSFKSDLFQKTGRITFKAIALPLKVVLDSIFKNTKIQYFQYGKQVILQNLNNNSKNSHDSLSSGKNGSLAPKDSLSTHKETYSQLEERIKLNLPSVSNISNKNIMTDSNPPGKYQKIADIDDTDPFNEYRNSLEPYPDPDEIKLKNCHTVSLVMGSKAGSDFSVGLSGINIQLGLSGRLSYGYWFEEEWMINLKLGIFGANTSVSTANLSVDLVTILQAGVLYYPAIFNIGSSGKFYGGVDIGIYSGTVSNINNLFIIGSESESVAGVEISSGLDFFLTDWLKVGPQISYHMVRDFKKISASLKNLSGTEFAFNLGIFM